MANVKSAAKRARQSIKRRNNNDTWRSRVKTFEKRLLTAVQTKDAKKAQAALVEFMGQMDKAAQQGVVHARKAARKISRLSKRVTSITP